MHELLAACADSVVDKTFQDTLPRGLQLPVFLRRPLRLKSLQRSLVVLSTLRTQDAIMWYARDGHGHERLQVVGLQCLVNFHRNAPTGTFHESILPCLKQLGRSATAGIRR